MREILSPLEQLMLPPFPRWDSIDACLRHRLLSFGVDHWTIGDSVTGTQVFGATGSGKTSGSGQALATAFIRAGFGGLVLTAKPDELANWVRYFRVAGATDDEIIDRVVVLQPDGLDHPAVTIPRARGSDEPLQLRVCHAFNVLDYEFRGGGRLTHSLVAVLLSALTQGDEGSRIDPFWTEALRELLVHTIDLATLAMGESTAAVLSARTLLDIVSSAPTSPEQAASTAWREDGRSACFVNLQRACAAARNRTLEVGRVTDLEQTIDYWMREFPALSEKTRSIVTSSFTAKLQAITRFPLRELLCGANDPHVSAAPCVSHLGKIVIMNVPTLVFGETGRFAQVLYKLVWQLATERRIAALEGFGASCPQRPVFLWCDESQHFVTKSDARFQHTARSSLAASVYLTQNISNYFTAVGGSHAREVTESMLGDLQTKVFHANGDPATNEWAERLFGKEMKHKTSLNMGQSASTGSGAASGTTQMTQGTSHTEEFLPVLEAKQFTTLATGGTRYGKKVEAFLYQAGRRWQVRHADGHLLTDGKGVPQRLRSNGEFSNVLFHVFEQSQRPGEAE